MCVAEVTTTGVDMKEEEVGVAMADRAGVKIEGDMVAGMNGELKYFNGFCSTFAFFRRVLSWK